MSVTSKSPLGVAREALAIGSATLREYTHRFSPKTYTQPQLFACLVLKTFLRTDYRGVWRILNEWTELRTILGLAKVPHFTTLQKASTRLLQAPRVKRLLAATLKRQWKRKRKLQRAALDSTGFQCGHASSYYTRRRAGDSKKPVFYKHYAKLELAVDCASHFIVAAMAGRGPAVDVDRFVPLLDRALKHVLLDCVLAMPATIPNRIIVTPVKAVVFALSFRPPTVARRLSFPPVVIGVACGSAWTRTTAATASVGKSKRCTP